MSDKLYRIRKLVWVEELTGDVGFAVLKAETRRHTGEG